MKKRTSEAIFSLKQEILSHKLVYLFLFLILLIAFFIRVYRVMDLMGFYYDQGRDGLVIWDLWHNHKPFLIGPITGLKGIFLGPFYYYLIAPFYLIGAGNPGYPSVFLSFTSVAAVFMLHVLGTKMHSRFTGLLAAFIGAFSYNIFTLSRWVSNPTPMLLLSMLLFWCLWEIATLEKKKTAWFWVSAVTTIGVSLHFESASAIFYLPMFTVFAIWQYKKLPNIKYIFISGVLFFSTFLPQIVFNFRHDNLLLKNFLDLLFGERAFRGLTKFIFEERMKYFWGVYIGKIFLGSGTAAIIFTTVSLAGLATAYKKFKKQIILFAIFFIIPSIGYLLFQGNYGNIYDYYTIGYFMPLILFFSIGMGEINKHVGGFLIVILYIYSFSILNFIPIKNYLTATAASRPIALEDQLAAVNWVFEDAKNINQNFNIDVYVPPVIPHAYDYLFLWQGTRRCGDSLCGLTKNENLAVLYTLYEADPPNPHRLDAWLNRQIGIGKVVEEVQFGQITVQRRERIK